MPTPPAAQGAPSWSWSSGGATSSASASPSFSSDPSSSSSPPALDPTSSSAPASSPRPHETPSSDSKENTSSSAPHSPPPPSCAACKHQRRRCEADCPLKPYFVTGDDEPDRFRNALRMFGVKNLQRMLRAVPPPRRDVCVQTVVYESNLRAADPVRGCCGVIEDLENQLMDTAVELEVLRRRLDSYRQMTRGGSEQQLMAKTSDDVQTQGPHGGVPPAANDLTATEMEPQLPQVQPQLYTMPP